MTDPEAKRKAIGGEFIRVFQEFADELKKKIGKLPRFLVQVNLSTAYPLFPLSQYKKKLPYRLKVGSFMLVNGPSLVSSLVFCSDPCSPTVTAL